VISSRTGRGGQPCRTRTSLNSSGFPIATPCARPRAVTGQIS
jgi:hypothetical protein